MREAVTKVLKFHPKTNNRTLLISFMGAGEPLLNYTNVARACCEIRLLLLPYYDKVKFAVSSIIPSVLAMTKFSELVEDNDLNVKFHFSLHDPFDHIRQELIPSGLMVSDSIEMLKRYKKMTGCAVEIHYTLINDVNDGPYARKELARLLKGAEMSVKFLTLSEKAGSPLRRSTRAQEMITYLAGEGISSEYYDPPGRDVGSSCGMFDTSIYNK